VSDVLSLAQFNLVTLGVALLIGVAAGRWMFRRPPDPEPPAEDQTQP
jgi:hypothetical protein